MGESQRLSGGVCWVVSTKKLHAAEIYAREQIAKAQSFSVYQYRYRSPVREFDFATMAFAIERAEELEKQHTEHPVLIYAYSGGVGYPVPADLRAAASAQSRGEAK